MSDIPDEVFKVFASNYPHESYEKWPERFWKFFHELYPNITKDQMIKELEDTK